MLNKENHLDNVKPHQQYRYQKEKTNVPNFIKNKIKGSRILETKPQCISTKESPYSKAI
jgi:hypothetical protein